MSFIIHGLPLDGVTFRMSRKFGRAAYELLTCRELSIKDGRLIFEFPIPLNSPVGTWKVNLRELASGKEASGMISVKYT